MDNRSGTSLALGISLLIVAAVIIDAVFTGRKPWDIVLAVARGEAVPKASAGTGASTPSASSTGASIKVGTTFTGQITGPIKAVMMTTYAMGQLGKPYDSSPSGRMGPNSFDCSGLIYKAAQYAGINLGATNSYGMADLGINIPVSPSNVKAGDLLFYYGDSPARPLGHVAMALDSTTMIQAPHTGANVEIKPIRYGGPADVPGGSVERIRRIV